MYFYTHIHIHKYISENIYNEGTYLYIQRDKHNTHTHSVEVYIHRLEGMRNHSFILNFEKKKIDLIV